MSILNLNLALIFSFCFLILPGCTGKIIEQEKLVNIYTDLLIAQDTASIANKSLDSLQQVVFKRYDVTEKDYEETLKYYNEDVKRWEEFFDKVIAHISSLSKSSPKEKAF